MADKLQRIFEYRVLLAKAQRRHAELDPQSQARLQRLRQQLPLSVPALDERDPYTLLPDPLAAEFAVSGHFSSGVLRNASGGGLAIATAAPPPLDQPVTVHVLDNTRALVYAFPARIVSRVVSGTTGMSVAFEGVPTLTRLAPQASGVFAAQAAVENGRKQRDSA